MGVIRDINYRGFYLRKVSTEEADPRLGWEGKRRGRDQKMLPNKPRVRRGVVTVSFRSVDRLFSCFMTYTTELKD